MSDTEQVPVEVKPKRQYNKTGNERNNLWKRICEENNITQFKKGSEGYEKVRAIYEEEKKKAKTQREKEYYERYRATNRYTTYYKDNRNTIRAKKRQYYEDHKEIIKARSADYYRNRKLRYRGKETGCTEIEEEDTDANQSAETNKTGDSTSVCTEVYDIRVIFE